MKLHVYLALVALASPSLAYNPDDFIHTLGATMWGFWGQTEACPEGSFAYGFEIKLEGDTFLSDDTSVNGIRLYCKDPSGSTTGQVTSTVMKFGKWRGADFCETGFLNGYDLKSEEEQGTFGDNTAANSLRMYCRDTSDYMESPGNQWGSWLGASHCRDGMAVCGLMTRVEEDQGDLSDDTALNDVRFLCCDLPA